MLKKIVYFKACFAELWAKIAIFYEILTSNPVILRNFQRKFCLCFAFFIFEDLAFFETGFMGKSGILIILDLATLPWKLYLNIFCTWRNEWRSFDECDDGGRLVGVELGLHLEPVRRVRRQWDPRFGMTPLHHDNSFANLKKTTFQHFQFNVWQKNEILSRFHQHFTRAFFVWNFGAKNYKAKT